MTGAPTATASTTAAATATTTAAEDPVLARIPAAARPETREGAEAFAAFFLESLNTAARTPDPTVLDGLFLRACETCVAMRDSVADLTRLGRKHTADSVRVKGTDPIVFTDQRRAVRVEIEQIAVDVTDKWGRTAYRTEAGTFSFAVTMVYRSGQWTVTKLQTIAS
ncbi:DUF6318 family protein [Intrasporangium sp.]|uniref:DUF6318 family protein n=1 Tax=Intrasporangium sp. TaxID=1925024 RepID=UPI00293AC069|nr:DUF6318 family protein [Intrasporangium sp.]MDV3223047.1 DUF6318 family protein [Intrasporangium sp.]